MSRSVEDIAKNLAEAIQDDQEATIPVTAVDAWVLAIAYRELDGDGLPVGPVLYRLAADRDLPHDRIIGLVEIGAQLAVEAAVS